MNQSRTTEFSSLYQGTLTDIKKVNSTYKFDLKKQLTLKWPFILICTYAFFVLFIFLQQTMLQEIPSKTRAAGYNSELASQ